MLSDIGFGFWVVLEPGVGLSDPLGSLASGEILWLYGSKARGYCSE